MRGTGRGWPGPAGGNRFIPAHAGNGGRVGVPHVGGAVHPRACGERCGAAADACPCHGSSPRMRGTVLQALRLLGRRRFIPAHAGNGPAPTCWASPATVHPRACGERSTVTAGLGRYPGSSPRMRGTDLGASRPRPKNRFIPAHAGNGLNAKQGADRIGGSSPRMRGTALSGIASKGTTRFIPAHAGNGRRFSRPTGTGPVHPRACGERGRAPHRNAGRLRFIPAHAGNGTLIATPSPAPSVHPRACGERLIAIRRADPLSGSSPRMRGTVERGLHDHHRRRFIPAHAGNGDSPSSSRVQEPVHPRACGERARGKAT